ncbi:MAG: TolC family protein [Clostridiales bacterium]|nr:TolC family protein [Clostridiales bacterium]
MRHTIYTLVTTIMMAMAINMAAQGSDSIFTLQQCRDMALRNNAAISISNNDYKAARETSREAFTKYFPEISAGGNAYWANHDMLQYNLLGKFTLGMLQNGKAAGVWAIQPVFMGGQIVNGNKLAHVGEEVAEIKREKAHDDVLLETDNIYWNLTALKATRQTVVSAVVMLDSLENVVKVAVEAGMAVQNDLLKVELKRNEFKNTLVDLDNGINLMKMLLAQQIGLGPVSTIETIDVVPDSVPEFPYTLFIDSRAALIQTPDHRLLVKNVEAKNLEKKIAIGSNMPTVGVGAGWVYHDILDQNHNFGAIMVSVNIPISGWWGGSHNIKKKNLELASARMQLDDLSQKLEIEMSDKWNNLTGAYRKMELSHRDIAQSRENLRITKAYYDAGMNTITDLLDAQTLYVESQSNYIAAYGNFEMSMTQYLNATGRL